MKLPGIFAMAQLGAGLVLAIPVAIVGVEFLRAGSTALGGAFLIVAALLVALPEYVSRRLPRPRKMVKKRLGRLRRE